MEGCEFVFSLHGKRLRKILTETGHVIVPLENLRGKSMHKIIKARDRYLRNLEKARNNLVTDETRMVWIPDEIAEVMEALVQVEDRAKHATPTQRKEIEREFMGKFAQFQAILAVRIDKGPAFNQQ